MAEFLGKYKLPEYSKKKKDFMYNFSSITYLLVLTFLLSLYFLYKVTSKAKD